MFTHKTPRIGKIYSKMEERMQKSRRKTNIKREIYFRKKLGIWSKQYILKEIAKTSLELLLELLPAAAAGASIR